MTEHVQLEIIAAVILIAMNIIGAWRAEMANRVAVKAQKDRAEKSEEQSVAIAQVHEAVNGGLAEAKREIVGLKSEVLDLKGQLVVARADVKPEIRLEEIRGAAMILAQLAGGYSFTSLAIGLILLCGVIGIVIIVVKATQINLPWWVWAILGVLGVCFLGIFAIRILERM